MRRGGQLPTLSHGLLKSRERALRHVNVLSTSQSLTFLCVCVNIRNESHVEQRQIESIQINLGKEASSNNSTWKAQTSVKENLIRIRSPYPEYRFGLQIRMTFQNLTGTS